MEPEPPERHFNIQIEPQALAGVYANFANVSHSDYEFTITFARVDHDVEGPEVPGRRRRARQPRAALHAPADRRAAGQLLEVVDPPGHQAAAGVRRRRRPRRRVARSSCASQSYRTSTATCRRWRRCSSTPSSEGFDELWCLGDVVGYGGKPSECLALVRERAAICLGGNHDLVVAGVLDIDQFTSDAGVAARWTRSVLTPGRARGARRCSRPRASGPASRSSTARSAIPIWEYVLTADVADASLQAADAPSSRSSATATCSSRSRWARRASRAARPSPSRRCTLEGKQLLNPGSVGQPRDRDPRAAWLLLDTRGRLGALHAQRVRDRRTRRPTSGQPDCPRGSPTGSRAVSSWRARWSCWAA